MENYDLIIIGAGPSGLFSAITAKLKRNLKILIIEKEKKIAKKISIAGNGRCNIYNVGKYKYFGSPEFANDVLGNNCSKFLESYLKKLGINIITDGEGRAYPSTYQSETVVDVLGLYLERLKIDVHTEELVIDIKIIDDMFYVVTNKDMYRSKIVNLSMGTDASYCIENSTNNLLDKLNIKYFDFLPALCPLCTDTKDIKTLSGLRVKANIAVDNNAYYSGEVLFTDYGVSGIVSMQVARFVKNKSKLHIDFRESMGLNYYNIEQIYNLLMERKSSFPNDNTDNLMIGLCNKKLARVLMKRAGIYTKNTIFKIITKDAIMELAKIIVDFTLDIFSTRGIKYSQVLSGGVDTKHVNPNTMEHNIKNLYICGEILNVDGDTGGYNLMFALKSGYNAGIAIAKKFK